MRFAKMVFIGVSALQVVFGGCKTAPTSSAVKDDQDVLGTMSPEESASRLAAAIGRIGCVLSVVPEQTLSLDGGSNDLTGRVIIVVRGASGAQACAAMIRDRVHGSRIDSILTPVNIIIAGSQPTLSGEPSISAANLGNSPVLGSETGEEVSAGLIRELSRASCVQNSMPERSMSLDETAASMATGRVLVLMRSPTSTAACVRQIREILTLGTISQVLPEFGIMIVSPLPTLSGGN